MPVHIAARISLLQPGQTEPSKKVKGRERATATVFDSLVASLAAELVSVSARVGREGLAVGIDFSLLTARLAQLKLGNTAGSLARHAGFAKSTAHAMEHEIGGKSLANLVRVAATAQVSPAGLLVPSLWRINPEDSCRTSDLPKRPKRRVFDWDQIRSELVGQGKYEGLDPSAIAGKLGIDPTHFNRNLRDLIPQLKAKAISARQKRWSEKASHVAVQIIDARRRLAANGTSVTCRRIAREIQVPRHRKAFTDGWQRSLTL